MNEESSDFGTMLSNAREAQNYSISDINDNIKIPEGVLSALETCDLAALPASTYTQGYIRSYARFLEISEDRVLDLYHQALPVGSSVPDVKLKTEIPVKYAGQSPLKSKLPVYLIVAAIAIIYTGYHYFQDPVDNSTDKVAVNELASEAGGVSSHLQEPSKSQPVQIEQNARMTDDGELILADKQQVADDAGQVELELESVDVDSAAGESAAVNSADVEPIIVDSSGSEMKTVGADNQPVVSDLSNKSVPVPIPPKPAQISEARAGEQERVKEALPKRPSQTTPDEQPSEDLIAEEDEGFPDDQATENQVSDGQGGTGQALSNQSPENQLSAAPAEDSITFYAEDGSWIEVLDANGRRLFYNTLSEGGSKTLTGQAPFSITMGNAKTTHVQINNIDVDFSNRIRSSNTASFKVSNKGQRVILQR